VRDKAGTFGSEDGRSRSRGGSSGRGGGTVETVDTDELYDECELVDNRFSDFREGVRGREENLFKFAPSPVRRPRDADEGLPSSPTSFEVFGGEREFRLARLKRLMGPRGDSIEIPTSSSEWAVRARISSAVTQTHELSFLNSSAVSSLG